MTKISINKFSIYIVFSIFVLFRMGGLLSTIPFIKYVYAIGELLVLVVACLQVIKSGIFNASVMLWLVTFFFGYNAINTFLKQGMSVQIFEAILDDYAIILVVLSVIKRGKMQQFVCITDRCFKFMLGVNFVHMLLNPLGWGFTRSMNKIFILASDNGLSLFLVVFIIFHELKNYYKPSKWYWNFLFYFICLYEIVVGEAATAIFIIGLLIFAIKLLKKINYATFSYIGFGIIVFLNSFVLFIRNFAFISTLVARVGKNTTFSGRTEIWDKAIALADKNFFSGLGLSENAYYVTRYNVLMEAHNMALSYLLQGGIVLLFIFVIIILYACHELVDNQKEYYTRFVAIGILAYLAIFLVESPVVVPGFFLLLGMCEQSKKKEI